MLQRLQVAKRFGDMNPSETAQEKATKPKTINKRSVFSIHTPTSVWASTLLQWLTFIGGISKAVVFSLLSYLPVAYGADSTIGDGDEFSNNLFSDLAPLMTLFGEQVTKQFISQSMGWADNILLAMAPLGILTIMVSAIRVGGEQWLKNIIGRARESDGLAEAELMSSTSDVCELWGGRGVVRVLGSPDLVELVYKVDGDGEVLEERYLRSSIHGLKGAVTHGIYQLKSTKVSEKPATLKEPPNLVLNVCGPGVGERELWAYAILGIILQISVWAWCILAVAFFKYEKGGDFVKPYALPVTITGSLFVCLGVLLCSRTVEASTTEHAYKKEEGVRTVFLQRGGQIVNDQLFEGYAIFTHGEQKEIRTSCKNNANFGVLINLATSLALVGFVAQFIGLRAMHWSCTIAQLLATLIMTVFRAAARRGLSTVADATPITEGYELQWLAKHLNRNDRWAIETGLIDLSQRVMDNCRIDQTRRNSCRKVVSLLQDLLTITDWERPLQKLAISTGRAMENILNTISREKDITTTPGFSKAEMINCQFPVNYNGSSTVIDFAMNRKEVEAGEWGPWAADTSKLEAILSLWMLSQNDAEKDWDIAATAVTLLWESGDRDSGEKFLKQAQETVFARERNYDQYRTNRQRGYMPIANRSEGTRITDSQQILGKVGEQRKHDYETWMELRGVGGGMFRYGVLEAHLGKPLEAPELPGQEDPLSHDTSRPWHTSFGFAFGAFGDEATKAEESDKYFVSTTRASGGDILGLDLVAKFMWEAAKHILQINGVTRRRIINLEESGSALVNSVLNKLAQSVVEAGLGELQDAYNIIIPPLSAAGKLPSEDINAAEKVIEV